MRVSAPQTVGAAILAATAAGHGPLPAAAARTTRIEHVFEPVASHSRPLQARFAGFTQELESLAPWWATRSPLCGRLPFDD